MAKTIRYKFLSCEVNHGTEETPSIEQIILDKSIECYTQAAYDANYPIAEKEAIAGTIEVSGEFDPEPEVPRTDAERIDELEEALNMILIGVTE
jgi:hypothetical protein